MRLVSYRAGSSDAWGVQVGDGVVDSRPPGAG